MTVKIDCAESWWSAATDDPHEVAAKYDVDVTVTVDCTSQRMHSTPLETLRMLLDFWHGTQLPVYHKRLAASNADTMCAMSFYDWYSRTQDNLKRIMLAYMTNYNPLENYNGEMTIIDTSDPVDPYSKTKTISGKVKHGSDLKSYGQSGKSTGTADTSTFGDFETEHYATTYDDTTTPKLQGKDTTASTGSYAHSVGSAADNFTEWDQYTETETETGTKDHTETRHGNLGVTTSQSMVSDELRLRKHDILREYLQQYVDDCLIWGDSYDDRPV